MVLRPRAMQRIVVRSVRPGFAHRLTHRALGQNPADAHDTSATRGTAGPKRVIGRAGWFAGLFVDGRTARGHRFDRQSLPVALTIAVMPARITSGGVDPSQQVMHVVGQALPLGAVDRVARLGTPNRQAVGNEADPFDGPTPRAGTANPVRVGVVVLTVADRSER
jgi:hypothetical protein